MHDWVGFPNPHVRLLSDLMEVVWQWLSGHFLFFCRLRGRLMNELAPKRINGNRFG